MVISQKGIHWSRRYLLGPLGGLLLGLTAWGYHLTLRWCPALLRYAVVLATAWAVYIFFFPWTGRTLRANIKVLHPELDSVAVSRVARRFLRSFSHTWTFLLSNVRVDLEDLRGRVENADLLLEYHKNGKPIVAVFPHVGPVNELIPVIQALLIRVFIPVEAVAPLLYRLMARQRCKYGDLVMEPVRKGKTLGRCAEALSEGRIVALAVDITGNEGNGILCRVGEASAYFPVGAVKLAFEQNATIFPVFPYYDEDWRPRLQIGEPFPLVSTGNLYADVEYNVRRLIEEVIDPFVQKWYPDWWRLWLGKLKKVA